MKEKITEVGLAFFSAAVLIYIGARLLLKVWWVLVAVVIVILVVVISFRVWKSRRSW